MNQKAIETLSINAVRDSIVTSDYLDQFIADNDKEPSWDGYVYIYKDSTKKKDKLKGRMPVQVKGKLQNDLSKNEITYSISKADLQNYLSDGGVMFFVVYIDYTGLTKKIYYAELAPVKLKSLLEQAKEQSSKSITLKPFPIDGNEKANIFMNCFNHCQKQASFWDAKLLSLEELEEQEGLEGISIPLTGVNINDPIMSLLTNEVYLYADIKGSAIPQPLKVIPTHIKTSKEVFTEISVNGVIYYSSYQIIRTANDVKLQIGMSFTIALNTSNYRTKIDYKNSESLRVVVKDLSFMIAVLNNGGFRIGDELITINTSDINYSNFDISQQKLILDFYLKAAKALDILGCSGDLDISKLPEKDLLNLQILITAFVDEKPVRGLNKNLNLLSTVSVDKYKFALLFQEDVNASGSYTVYDFFNIGLGFSYSDQEGNAKQIPQYAVMHPEDYINISNVKYDSLLKSFEKFKSDPSTFELANQTLLNLLSAYDKSGGEKTILLRTAKELSDWVIDEEKDDIIPYNIKLLNRLQIARRERMLNDSEIKELYKIAEDNRLEEELRIGAYLLLDNQIAASIHLDNLGEKEKQEFMNYPIYYFCKDYDEKIKNK